MSTTAQEAAWQTVYSVRSYEVDARGLLAVATVANFLQDTAGSHAHALGVSIDHLRPRHLTWVLVRLRLQLDRHLAWQDRLRILTWPFRQERLIRSPSTGTDLARIATRWRQNI